MSKQAEKEEKNIWDVVFRVNKPIRVAFHGADTENEYTFEWRAQEGIYVTYPTETADKDKTLPSTRKILFIPFTSIDYLAWISEGENENAD